ncbi:MAG: hypothetical protein IJ335_02995 [Lachnospiraceae bacterium]|nr:hypothetical protein [Lachnospiraceae bacterium]
MNLLYPYGKEKSRKIFPDTYQHLALAELVDRIAIKEYDRKLVQAVFENIPTDMETIRFRQDILRDFMENEAFCRALGDALKKLDVLKEYRSNNHYLQRKKASIWDFIDYMEEMEVYIQVIEEMNRLFAEYKMTSKGLTEIAMSLGDVIDTERIEELKEFVGSMKADISTLKSVTVGINLTPELHPEEIIILDLNQFPFRSRLRHINWSASIAAQREVSYKEPSQLMKYMTQDMERELAQQMRQYKKQLQSYINLSGYFLLDICDDLKYYLLLATFAQKLQEKGYTICLPKLQEDVDQVLIKGVYNVRLTEKNTEQIVKNDFSFQPKEKIYILTGPNRGGKTMLTQAIGIAAFMAAQGLYVLAEEYIGCVFENILTHFPADENQTLDMGRLGEEAVRIREILKGATPRTLLLLNETYSSTCASDGLYLANDLVHILKYRDIPTIFNTHIHELARSVSQMNQWEGKSDVVSLTMEIKDNVNTFRVLRAEPDTCSYAQNIARKYGVTFEQMLKETI